MVYREKAERGREGEEKKRRGRENYHGKIGGCTCRKNRHGKFIREHKEFEEQKSIK